MLEVTICSARDLKYRWRGLPWRPQVPFRPFAVVYVNTTEMFSTDVDEERDRCPYWGATQSIRLVGHDTTLKVVIFDARRDGINRKLGSASLELKEVVNYVGYGQLARQTLQLKRFSGMSRGDVTVEVLITEPGTAQPDGQPPRWTRNLLRGLRFGLMVADVLNDVLEDDEGDDVEGILD